MLRILGSNTIKATSTRRFAASSSRFFSASSAVRQDGEKKKANLNRHSSIITQPKSQGPSQAMLYGTGLKEEDMDKAQVGIS
ncbi:hypothetical protein GGI12_004402, partial [Dipsacomyces acuminosporus]